MHCAHNNRIKILPSKPLLPSSKVHLPTVSKTTQHRFRSSSIAPIPSMASANITENVSALKAKYTDYAMWLKASSKQNHEPIFTHELLKQFLCQMGIDSSQADQLVSTCSWYVYQFQQEMKADMKQTHQTIITETKKLSPSPKRRHKKIHTIQSRRTMSSREHSTDSATTINSINKENSISSGSSSPTRNKFPVLPSIPSSNPPMSPRSRRVDFDNEQQSIGKEKPSHWHSAVVKARVLPKLRPSETEPPAINHTDTPPGSTPDDLDLSSPQKSAHRTGLGSHHARSILRKQPSSCSSATPIDMHYRKTRNLLLTSSSPIIDEIPLGTKSQRLFGGSKCFAEIMNELEEQNLQ